MSARLLEIADELKQKVRERDSIGAQMDALEDKTEWTPEQEERYEVLSSQYTELENEINDLKKRS